MIEIQNPSSTEKKTGIQQVEPRILAMEYRIQDCLGWIPFIHGKHGSSTYLQKIFFSILWRKMHLWYMYLFVN